MISTKLALRYWNSEVAHECLDICARQGQSSIMLLVCVYKQYATNAKYGISGTCVNIANIELSNIGHIGSSEH